MIIYITTNTINGKKYIGQDSTNNSQYKGSGTIIKAAIKKYGTVNFVKEILEQLPINSHKKLLDEREKYYIKKYNAVEDINFYNISEGGGGCLGYKFTDDQCNHQKTIKRTKEWKEAIAESLRGIKHTKDRNIKNSESQIGLQAGSRNPRARLFIITDPNGIEYKVKGELKKFCIENNLSPGCMLKVAKGNQKQHKEWNIKYEDGNGPYVK